MAAFNKIEILFIASAYLFQLILITHFALRKWRFDLAVRYGPIVYGLSVPAAVVSIFILLGGRAWYWGSSSLIYLAWAIFGYYIEYIKEIEWRNSLHWPVMGPYVVLYLATVMFYWWPLALIYKPLWYGYGVLFLISTFFNVSSHRRRVAVTT
jgi:hypothetical protein